MKWAEFLHADTNLEKQNVYLIINNGRNLSDYETQKTGASQKWFDESSRLIK